MSQRSRRRRWARWLGDGFGPCLRATLTFHLTVDVLALTAATVAVVSGLVDLTDALPLVLVGGLGKTALAGLEAMWKCRAYLRWQDAADQSDVY